MDANFNEWVRAPCNLVPPELMLQRPGSRLWAGCIYACIVAGLGVCCSTFQNVEQIGADGTRSLWLLAGRTVLRVKDRPALSTGLDVTLTQSSFREVSMR